MFNTVQSFMNLESEGKSEQKQEGIKKRLIRDIIRFLIQEHKGLLMEARCCFWKGCWCLDYLDKQALLIAESNFWDWVLYDYIIEGSGQRVLDLYTEKVQPSEEERVVLGIMRLSVLSLYEVKKPLSSGLILLKDLFRKGEYLVSPRRIPYPLEKQEIFATRLLCLDERYITSGAFYHYPPGEKKVILTHLKNLYEDYLRSHPHADRDLFLKNQSKIFNFYWWYYRHFEIER